MIAIDAPGVVARPAAGLLRVANVVENADGHILYDGAKFESAYCGPNEEIPETAEDPEEQELKVFREGGLNEVVRFGQYRGVDFALLTHKGDAAQAVQAAFLSHESYGVEKMVQKYLLNPDAVDITPTPGTPVTSPRLALGLLEQYASDHYAGLPILHGNRLAVGFIPELQVDGVALSTIHGTPIANGGGYSTNGPGAAEADDGTAWLYISGQVTVWKGGLIIPEGVYDLKKNREIALAERQYAASVDCFVAAILVGIA